ncbi:MAG: hypothetical protein ACHQ51_01555 [Elusimicrobiota bacterium]
MRRAVWIAVLTVIAARNARADEPWAAAAFEGARAALASRPPAGSLKSEAPADVSMLRAALIARLKRNPLAAEFAVPILEAKGGVTLVVRSESEDASLKGAWATYKRDSRTLVLNRDAIASDLPGGFDADRIADRYMPVFVHELGGHARHYRELAVILGAPAPNARETETNALRLEAMTTAAERKTNPSYLRDDKEYARGESGLVDQYWKSKARRDPGLFAAYVSTLPGYAKIPEASGRVGDYYRGEEFSLLAADRRLVGDEIPDDESDAVRRERPLDGSRSMRR